MRLKRTTTLLAYLGLLTFFTAPGAFAQGDVVITPEVVWTFETGGPIWGSSTTRDGVVYFGSTDGTVYALDAGTGALTWSFETGGPIYGAVTVYEDYLYTSSDDGYLYKLNRADGTEIWKANIHERTARERHRPADYQGADEWDFRGSAPTEVDGLVYVGSPDTRLYALDAETGDKTWHFQTGHIVRSSPVVAEGLVVFGSFDHRVYALDKDTGKEMWRYNTGGVVSPAPVIHEGVVFIGSRSTRLYAIDLETGDVIWTKPYGNGSWVESGGVVYDNTLYIGSSFWSTQLSVNLETGASNWQSVTGGAAYSTPRLTEEAHYSGTVGLENTLSGNMKGALVRLDRETGRVVWRFPFSIIPGHYDHGVSATPEVVDERILFGALDGIFYALEETESAAGDTPINLFENFDDADALRSWQNTTAGGYSLTTVTDDKVEGEASTRLEYNLVADLDWGGSIDVARAPAEGTFDFSGVTGVAMHVKVVEPASEPANVSFVFKLVDASTGVDEFWEQAVPSVLGDASGEWQQLFIPMDGFAIPDWADQGDATLDLDQIKEWQFQVIANGMAVGTTTTGAFLFDQLGTYGGGATGQVLDEVIQDFEDSEVLESWQNSTAGSYAITTVTDDKVEGEASVELAYNLVVDLDWGGSIDMKGLPAGEVFDFTGVTGLAMNYKVTDPASDPTSINFVFKLVDASTGVDEFWEQTVPGILDDATGEWQQMLIPMDGFFLPSWTDQGDATLDLDQINEWQLQVIASSMAIGATITGAIRFDQLGTYGTSGVGVEEDAGAGVPAAYVLHSNYPNPFNPTTFIRYELTQAAHVVLKVFNVMGQEVAVLVDGIAPAGLHGVRFDASALPSGVYYYQVQAGDVVEARSMTLVR